jgi:DNA-3-methyladenine glycosylase II
MCTVRSQRTISAHPDAVARLSEDPVMADLIGRYGRLSYPTETDYFASLLSTIVGQQLSGKVADVLWARFLKLTGGGATPLTVLETDAEAIRAAGISYPKVRYMKNIAEAALAGAVTFDRFDKMPDGEIVAQLTAVKGIGRWTAEMFLIFTLGREDVFSAGDGGLPRAIAALYGAGAAAPQETRAEFAKRWSPYRSIASLYLWASLNNKSNMHVEN